MKIDPTGTARPSTSARRGERAGGARSSEFSRHLDSGTAASGVSGSTPLGAVQALLSLQEVEDATTRRARAVRRGQDLLDRLDDIRDALLAGVLPRGAIVALADLVRAQRPSVVDPNLQEVLDEIELRAAVELAKLDHVEGG